MGLFDKIKQGLKKTRQLLNTDVRDLFKSQGELVNDAFLEKINELLIKSDIGVQAARAIVEEIGTTYRARVMLLDDCLATIKKKLKELMAQDDAPLRFAASGPTVIMVCGRERRRQNHYDRQAHATVDFAKQTGRSRRRRHVPRRRRRAAWRVGQSPGREIVKGEQNSDPASVAHRAVALAIESQADICIVDTAGRLQTQQNLMQQLTKIHRVIGKQIPEAPHEVLLVLDATTGQNGISQAKHFTDAVKLYRHRVGKA